MKKLIFILLLIAGLAIVLVSCSNGNNGYKIILNQNDPTVIKDGSTLAPNSVVKFAWTDLAGNSVLCDFILERDGMVVEQLDDVREVITSVSEEGHYMASIMPSGSRDVKSVTFIVNKLYEELYNSSHGLYFKDDVSDLFKQFNDKGQEKAGIIFFRLGNEKIEGTNEIINTSEGLHL